MKKNKSSIIVVIFAGIMTVVCLYQNYKLRQDIIYLKNQQEQFLSSVEVNRLNIYQEVQDMLKKEASILSASSWEYVSSDIENGTVDVICRVTPKEYSEVQTAAKIVCEGKEYPMDMVNGEYVTELTLSVFQDSVVDKVMFTEGDATRTEVLSWGISPHYDYLTMVYATMEYSVRKGNELSGVTYSWNLEGLVHIDVERKGQAVSVKSIALVEQIDGEVVSRTEIPLSTKISESDSMNQQYVYELKGEYEIPIGSTICLYIETVDGDGLYHRNILEKFVVTDEIKEEGSLEAIQVWNGAESNLYDAEGNALYEIEESLYK